MILTCLLWDTTRYTDWQKALLGGTARYNDAQGTVSGGNSNTQFLIGGGYHRETTVFPGDFSDQRGSLHFNITNFSTDRRFKLLLSGNYTVNYNQLTGVDLTSTAIQTPPDAPSLYNADGSLNWAPSASGFTSWPTGNNPLSYLYYSYNNHTNNLVSNALVSYQLLPGLEIKSSLGYTDMQTNETSLTPTHYWDPALLPSLGNSARTASYANNAIRSWIIEPQATYSANLWQGRLTALVGTTIQQNTLNGQVLNASGFNSDLVMNDIKSASAVTIGSTTNSLYKYNALFGRLTYDWQEKYLLNLSTRRDGSSRFGPQNQFHNFEAASIGWIFSKENVISRNFSFLSFGKLRASYGTTGSDQIGDYSFLDLYRPTTAGVPYQGATGLQINNLFNPALAWEETTKAEGGLDLGFLKDRVLINVTYFHNRSSNQLVAYSLPSIAGETSVATNLPAIVLNTGWEATLSTTSILTPATFRWRSSFNLTIPP